MAVSLALYGLAVWGLMAAFGNHGLWAAVMVLMVVRAASLGVLYPALEASIKPRKSSLGPVSKQPSPC